MYMTFKCSCGEELDVSMGKYKADPEFIVEPCPECKKDEDEE